MDGQHPNSARVTTSSMTHRTASRKAGASEEADRVASTGANLLVLIPTGLAMLVAGALLLLTRQRRRAW